MINRTETATTAGNDVFRTRVLVLMGVCGCVKTAVGEAVAARWKARFEDADRWHSPEAVAKMSAGHPLTDEERAPWLERMREKIIAATAPGERTVLACSALRRRYRDALRAGQPDVRFVYLEGSRQVIAGRMNARTGHFMPSTLLDSQLAALEVPGPEEADTVSIDQPLESVIGDVWSLLKESQA